MASLVKTVELQILAKDGDAQAKIDAISAKADELREKNPELSVRINTAEASAKLKVFREELKDATRTVDVKIKAKVDETGSGGASGFLAKVGSLLSLSSGSLGGTGGGVGSIAAVGAIAQGLTAGVVAAGGLAAALAPISSKILPEITSRFGKWEAQIDKTKEAKTAISDAGKAFGSLLSAVTPLTESMMPSLVRLINDFSKSATSGGIKTFFTWMTTNAPKAFNAVAQGVKIAGGTIHTLLPLISTVSDVFKIFFHLLDAGFDLVGATMDLLTGHWSAAGTRLKSVTGNIGGVFKNFGDIIKHVLGNVVSWFGGLPGKILGALSKLPGLLFNAGKNAVEGLINGLKSIPVIGPAISWGSNIVSGFAHKLGISSPSKVMFQHGLWTAKGLELGLRAGTAGVGTSALAMAQAVGIGTGTGGGGRAGVMRVQLEWVGGGGTDTEFLSWLQKNIRLRGGGGPNSVQRALGQVT